METKQQIFPPLPQYQHLTFDELKRQLSDDSPQVRASALAALGSPPLPSNLFLIAETIDDDENRKTPWFGFITVSWVGVVVLLETGDAKALELAKKAVSRWPTDERHHLASWLKDFPAYAKALNEF